MAAASFPIPLLTDALTADQVAFIRKSISSRRKELFSILKILGDEEEQSQVLGGTIAQLQKANQDAKTTLLSLEGVLNPMLKSKKDIELLESITRAPPAQVPRVMATPDEILKLVDGQIADTSKDLSHYISGIKERISQLRLSIQKMETELYSKRLVHAASSKHVEDAKKYQKMIESSITLLISGVNWIQGMPVELLVKIFRICVDKEVEDYLDKQKAYMKPVTTLNLSRVCRLWRGTTLDERDLWRFMAIYSQSAWSSRRLTMFKHACTYKPPHPTLAFSLSLSNQRTYGYDGWSQNVTFGADAIRLVETYDLSIFADVNDLSTLPTCPFTQPTSVVLHLFVSVSRRSFEGLLTPFPNIKKLTILCKENFDPLSPRLPEIQPQLTHLTLNLGGSISIDLAGYLVPNLVELHIIQGQPSIIPAPNPGLSLPKLKVLGVTPPNTGFAHSLTLPMLRKVVLYGIQDLNLSAPITLVQFASAIGLDKVHELELRNWPHPVIRWLGIRLPGNIHCITEIAGQMRSIVKLKCVESAFYSGSLVDLVEELTLYAKTTATLETVIIDRCSGVTRADCEAIGGLVKKMEIYA